MGAKSSANPSAAGGAGCHLNPLRVRAGTPERGGINALVDRGHARAAETGSFIPGEGWTIEGNGFTPDVVADNNSAAAYRGEDAQLDAAIKYLQEKIAAKPKHLLPVPPPYPDKTLKK